MKNLLILFLLGCLIGLSNCQQSLKSTQTSTYEMVKNGQYPIKLSLPKSLQHFAYFEVLDTQNKLNYPAQKWKADTILILAKSPNNFSSESLKIKGSNKSFYPEIISIKKTTTALTVTKNDKPLLNYQIAEQLPAGATDYYKRSGFIHPLFSPNGKITSDDFPEGHTHQHAIFFAFVNTTYKGEKLDFWNQHQGTGTIQFSSLDNYQSGSVFGKFETVQDHISLKHGIILKEKWEVTIYNTEPYRIDIHTTLQSVAQDTLFINDYHYGGMAFRGSKTWNSVDSLHYQNEPIFHTNEGKNRAAANHSRPKWSALEGLIDGQQAGVAMLGHPTNFRYPEPIRIHPTMPYFCVAPMVGEAFYIAPNGRFEGTYTYISYDGEVPMDLLNNLSEQLQ